MPNEKSILFVCMGNICRSPAADGIFADFVVERDLQDVIRVDSAGTHGYHIGDLADPRMREAAAQRGHDLQSRARKVLPTDLQQFDLVIAMDRDNLTIVDSLDDQNAADDRHAEVLLFSHFLNEEGNIDWPIDVPDPYYGGPQGFETVLDMIQAGCPAILNWLQDRQRD